MTTPGGNIPGAGSGPLRLPLPRLPLLPLPEKLKQIAPELAEWERGQQEAFEQYRRELDVYMKGLS